MMLLGQRPTVFEDTEQAQVCPEGHGIGWSNTQRVDGKISRMRCTICHRPWDFHYGVGSNNHLHYTPEQIANREDI